jgi:hypothetical protein
VANPSARHRSPPNHVRLRQRRRCDTAISRPIQSVGGWRRLAFRSAGVPPALLIFFVVHVNGWAANPSALNASLALLILHVAQVFRPEAFGQVANPSARHRSPPNHVRLPQRRRCDTAISRPIQSVGGWRRLAFRNAGVPPALLIFFVVHVNGWAANPSALNASLALLILHVAQVFKPEAFGGGRQSLECSPEAKL